MGIIARNLNIRGNFSVGRVTTSITPPAPDVTPNPTPDWSDITYDGFSGEYTYTSQLIKGINAAIKLKVNYDDKLSTGVGFLYYYEGTQQPFPNGSFPPSTQSSTSEFTYIQINNNGIIDVTEGNWIGFGLESNYSTNLPVTVTVINVSDENTQLDQFSMSNINMG